MSNFQSKLDEDPYNPPLYGPINYNHPKYGPGGYQQPKDALIVNEDNSELLFSTGTKMYANMGVIGIGLRDGDIVISEGYDTGFDDDILTKQERDELADYMINLWKKYKSDNNE